MNQRIGIFGWGVVAPKSPDIDTFERNLGGTTSWLEPFDGFGPSNFLVGRPEFDFADYKSWIDSRFEPRRYSQLQSKMGNTVKYAIGAFIQALGQNPGLEVLSVAISSDADHIITPSKEGPRLAIQQALAEAGVKPEDVATWDMHATATPGDWSELQNILALLPESTAFTARKGTFGHGMSVCGGWELTAQHLGFSKGELLPVNLSSDEIHDQIRPYYRCLVHDEARPTDGDVAGKINMGVGGINACVICRRW